MPYPDGSEVHRHLLLMKHLGIDTAGDHLEFPLNPNDQKDFDDLLLPIDAKNFVCIHPGSRATWRQWPPQYFGAIADFCIEQGFVVVITGTKEESDITREVIKCMHHLPVDITSKTTLGAMAILIKNAFALISNCTGISHLADAFDTPSVIISMDGEPERWAPINKNMHRVIDATKDPHFETVLLQTNTLFQDLLLPKN
jgi:ADP-heptose:LPS heptosyltransferase